MRHIAQYQNADSATNPIHSYQKHDKTYWGHVHDELPERLFSRLREHIPHGIVDRCKSEMNDTLLWADPYIRPRLASSTRSHADCGCLPAQLGVTRHPIPCLTHVCEKLLGIAAYQALGENLDSMADLIARNIDYHLREHCRKKRGVVEPQARSLPTIHHPLIPSTAIRETPIHSTSVYQIKGGHLDDSRYQSPDRW